MPSGMTNVTVHFSTFFAWSFFFGWFGMIHALLGCCHTLKPANAFLIKALKAVTFFLILTRIAVTGYGSYLSIIKSGQFCIGTTVPDGFPKVGVLNKTGILMTIILIFWWFVIGTGMFVCICLCLKKRRATKKAE